MRKWKRIVYIAVLLITIQFTGIDAQAMEANISINKVFMRYDEGYFGKIHLDLVETQGFYLEMLQIGEYYQQIGTGLEFLALKRPRGEVWVLLGRDEYEILQIKNSLVRAGFRVVMPIAMVDLSISADLMMDDLTGVFLRYQLELRSPREWLQTNLGCGNLLGSKDGYSFWIGFNL